MSAAQLSIFDPRRPVSRPNQPTSQASEKTLRESGALGDQCQQTLDALRRYIAANGTLPTTAELAGGDFAKLRIYSKRLPDLRETGAVTNPGTARCAITKRVCMTWRPA